MDEFQRFVAEAAVNREMGEVGRDHLGAREDLGFVPLG
jgi:hypothetical protein